MPISIDNLMKILPAIIVNINRNLVIKKNF